MATKDKTNAGNLGFEAEMFKAADKLRGNMEPSDYKHVVLGLIFLKYIIHQIIQHSDIVLNILIHFLYYVFSNENYLFS